MFVSKKEKEHALAQIEFSISCCFRLSHFFLSLSLLFILLLQFHRDWALTFNKTVSNQLLLEWLPARKEEKSSGKTVCRLNAKPI